MGIANNFVSLAGMVVKQPEMQYTANGMAIFTMRIAVDCGKDKNGERKSLFTTVKMFGKQAESAHGIIQNKSRVLVHGRIDPYEYTNKDGEKRSGFDVIADDWMMLGDREAAITGEDEPGGEEEMPF